ncbi:MAG: hypothetical protein CMO41_04555 [Verrucomicrobiales bacterium]|nr:hypothetical protein [Verrucomicrobiales bacterium]|tara:strand:- start:1322 stop:2011 length:690 start_codon:yes stop_codon:yes gene_type:complete
MPKRSSASRSNTPPVAHSVPAYYNHGQGMGNHHAVQDAEFEAVRNMPLTARKFDMLASILLKRIPVTDLHNMLQGKHGPAFDLAFYLNQMRMTHMQLFSLAYDLGLKSGCYMTEEASMRELEELAEQVSWPCTQEIQAAQATQPHSSGNTMSVAQVTAFARRLHPAPMPRLSPSSTRSRRLCKQQIHSHCARDSHCSSQVGMTHFSCNCNSRSVIRALRRFHTGQCCFE